MAEKEGIHPDVMHHIVDLHRKVSELQLQHHDKGAQVPDEPHALFQEMLAELKEINAHLKELTSAGSPTQESTSGRRRERKSAPAASGAAETEA